MDNNKGLIRRLDELGRVVIPKEIRHSLKIENGNLLEFFYTQEKGLCVQKIEPIREIGDFGEKIMYALREYPSIGFLLCDMQKIVVAQNCSKKDNVGKKLSSALIEKLKHTKKTFEYQQNEDEKFLIFPIICQGDVVGGVLVNKKTPIGEDVSGAVKLVARILGDYLDE